MGPSTSTKIVAKGKRPLYVLKGVRVGENAKGKKKVRNYVGERGKEKKRPELENRPMEYSRLRSKRLEKRRGKNELMISRKEKRR